MKGSTEQQEADICHWVFVTGAISRQMSMTRCAAWIRACLSRSDLAYHQVCWWWPELLACMKWRGSLLASHLCENGAQAPLLCCARGTAAEAALCQAAKMMQHSAA